MHKCSLTASKSGASFVWRIITDSKAFWQLTINHPCETDLALLQLLPACLGTSFYSFCCTLCAKHLRLEGHLNTWTPLCHSQALAIQTLVTMEECVKAVQSRGETPLLDICANVPPASMESTASTVRLANFLHATVLLCWFSVLFLHLCFSGIQSLITQFSCCFWSL